MTIRAGDMAQIVEHLPDKCKALSSNLSTLKKNQTWGLIYIQQSMLIWSLQFAKLW
jgi:hypothetical protein